MKPSPLLLAGLALCLSCQPQSTQEKAAATAAPDSAALLATRPGRDAPRSAADRLVRALYFEHNKTDNPFREGDRALLEQYFAKPVADQIWEAGKGKTRPGAVNPLFNAPDRAISQTWVMPAAVAGSRAVVYVTFAHNANPAEIRVDLQQQNGRWRITDLLYPDGKRLTDVF